MLLVVLGHAIQYTIKDGCFDNYLWNLIYSFHMPAFVAISGYLAYRGDKQEVAELGGQLLRRFRQLFIPFLFWSYLKYLITPPYTLKEAIYIFVYPDGGAFWFLYALFFIVSIFIAMKWLAKKLRIKEWITEITAAVILVGLMVVLDLRLFGFQFIAYYFLFYLIGYYYHKHDNKIRSNIWLGLLLSVVWLFLGSFWSMHEPPVFLEGVSFVPVVLIQHGYRFITAAMAILAILILAPKFINGKGILYAAIVNFGQESLGVYPTHIILMPYLLSLSMSLLPGTSITWRIVILFVTTTIMAYLLVKLLSKNQITARVFLGRINKS